MTPKERFSELNRKLTKKHKPILDKQYEKEYEKQNHHRRAELYAAELLTNPTYGNSFKLKKSSKTKNGQEEGPDFIVYNSQNDFFYVEVKDQSPKEQTQEEVFKKLINSLKEKEKQYKKWVKKGIIDVKAPFVIFIGFYGFDSTIAIKPENVPLIKQHLGFNMSADISAVIISSCCDQLILMGEKENLYNDMRLFINRDAKNPFLFDISVKSMEPVEKVMERPPLLKSKVEIKEVNGRKIRIEGSKLEFDSRPKPEQKMRVLL